MRFEFVVRSGRKRADGALIRADHLAGPLEGLRSGGPRHAASAAHCGTHISAREDVAWCSDLQSANGTSSTTNALPASNYSAPTASGSARPSSELLEATPTASGSPAAAERRHHVPQHGRSAQPDHRAARRRHDQARVTLSRSTSARTNRVSWNRRRKYLKTLHKVSEILSRASSVEALFDSIVAAILGARRRSRGILMRPRDGDPKEINMVVVRTKDGQGSGACVMLSRRHRQRRVREGHLGVNRRCRWRRSIRGRREASCGSASGSVMCAPMRTTTTILGVLYVDSQMAREFSEAELELLAAVGTRPASRCTAPPDGGVEKVFSTS